MTTYNDDYAKIDSMNKPSFSRLMLRIINARYSVSSWMWVLVSLMVGAFLFLTVLAGTAPGLQEFLDALPFNGPVWTGSLVLASLVKMYGMAFGKDRVVKWGAALSFVLWVFGAITFALLGQLQAVFFLIAPILIFNFYLFFVSQFRTKSQA